MPYYEPYFTEPTPSKTEDECYKDCIQHSDCIQYVFFQNEVEHIDGTKTSGNSCYLKDSFDIFASVLHDKNAIVYTLKSLFWKLFQSNLSKLNNCS